MYCNYIDSSIYYNRQQEREKKNFGVWRSLAARVVWDHEVGGSNPLTPTIEKRRIVEPILLFSFFMLVLPLNQQQFFRLIYK